MKPSLLILAVVALAWFFPSPGGASSPTEGVGGAAVSLPRTGQILSYDQTGKIIDFKGSGQDGEFQRGEIWPDPRFVDNEDGTITDVLTGLMWLKEGNCFGDLPWPAAEQAVSDFNRGAITCPGVKSKHNDWFMPDLNQLILLVDFQAQKIGDALRLVGFSKIQNGVYWSNTRNRNQQNAWSVDFANGSVSAVSKLERHFMLVARLPESGRKDKKSPEVTAENTSAHRFLDNTDGTVTDSWTGLTWLQDASCLPMLDWQGALTAARQLATGRGDVECPSLRGGNRNWSLPNVAELRSLIDYTTDYPALSPGNPFLQVSEAGYWTSTTVSASPDHAFAGDLETGAMVAANKTEKRRVLAVSQANADPERPRKESDLNRGAMGVDPRYVLAIDPEMISEVKWPPEGRFANNGDGTSLDIITGINWLTDANCFGKKSWKDAVDGVAKLNTQAMASASSAVRTQASRRNEIKCEGYEGSIDDWVMPSLEELLHLINPEEQDSAAWLNRQGILNAQSSGIYWTGTETPLNLYFADAVTLKTGKPGNYPKSLKFYVWPHRKVPEVKGKDIEPFLNLTANTIGNQIILSPEDPLSLVVFLHTFGLQKPADFWFWYDTPDEKRLWLTSIRTWVDKAKPVYQGPLFNLVNYEIFRSAVNGLPPGVYNFHFAVDTVPNGILDEVRSEVMMQVQVVIPGGSE